MKNSQALVEKVVSSIGDTLVSDDSLMHYASPYYDPVKAKEYYERTKQLKGRTSGLSKTQREAYAVSKSNIATAKKQETEKAQVDQKARLEGIRAKADQARKAVEEKLQKLTEDLSKKAEKLVEEHKALPLNKIPPNASPKQKEFLKKQNDRIRATNAKNANKKMQENRKVLDSVRKDVARQRQEIGEGLKADLQKARDTYKANMESMKAKYEQASNTELENIRTQVK